jgi:hypothetical protein
MNCQPKSISTIPTLLGVVTLVSLMSFAADRLPILAVGVSNPPNGAHMK